MTTTETTAVTAQNATETVTFDLTQPKLIGLFGAAGGLRAMLRGADGTVVMANPEDVTPMGDVMAITKTYVLLRNGRAIRRLTLPE
jgi:hypothetical protein